ncbi:hypothetical protein MNBD_GAMMA22-720 [hydrothermal vent metagenome]|uniref:Uncharacterized protein n=1 Tax=hydrothermal vent metagenome TaxID=652676 RepID=A0A3B1AL85_9ZZZZ
MRCCRYSYWKIVGGRGGAIGGLHLVKSYYVQFRIKILIHLDDVVITFKESAEEF